MKLQILIHFLNFRKLQATQIKTLIIIILVVSMILQTFNGQNNRKDQLRHKKKHKVQIRVLTSISNKKNNQQ